MTTPAHAIALKESSQVRSMSPDLSHVASSPSSREQPGYTLGQSEIQVRYKWIISEYCALLFHRPYTL